MFSNENSGAHLKHKFCSKLNDSRVTSGVDRAERGAGEADSRIVPQEEVRQVEGLAANLQRLPLGYPEYPGEGGIHLEYPRPAKAKSTHVPLRPQCRLRERLRVQVAQETVGVWIRQELV